MRTPAVKSFRLPSMLKPTLAVSLLVASLAFAQRGGARDGALVITDGSLYAASPDLRDELQKKISKVSSLVGEVLSRSRNDREVRRALRDADDMLGSLDEIFATGGRINLVGADGQSDGGVPKLRAARAGQLITVSAREVVNDLVEADTAIGEAENLLARNAALQGKLREARTLLRGAADVFGSFLPRGSMPQYSSGTGTAPPPGGGTTPPTVAPPANKPMTQEARVALFRAVDRERTPQDKLRILEEAARNRYFTVADVEQVIGRFDRPAHKLQAVSVIRARIVDQENTFSLYGAFASGRDKDELKRVLAGERLALTPVAADQFKELVKRIENAYTDDDALADLANESGEHYFLSEQVAKILTTFSSPTNKMRAFEAVHTRVLDPQNYGRIQSAFSTSADRAKVRDALWKR